MIEGIYRFDLASGYAKSTPDSIDSDDAALECRLDGPLAIRASSAAHLLFGELRLDNHDDLAEAIGTAGASPPGAIVLAVIERFGLAGIDRIEGEFSLALWDRGKRRLLLIRDAIGRRPLYFAADRGRILFGSSAGSLARRIGDPRADTDELVAFALQRGHVGTGSFFRRVSQVGAGSLLEIRADGSTSAERWWHPDYSPIQLGDAALLDALEQELDRSIAAIERHYPRRTAHLSAGLDSSLAVLTMSRRMPTGDRLHAFCSSPARLVTVAGEPEIGDEYPLAAQTAAMLGNVDIERVTADGHDWLAVSDRFAAAAGMPYANQANLGWLAATYARGNELGAGVLVESTQGNATFSWQGKGAVPTLIRHGRFAALARFVRDARRTAGGSGLMTIPWGLFAMLPPQVADGLSALAGTPNAATTAMLRRDHPAVQRAIRRLRQAGQFTRSVRASRAAPDRLHHLHWGNMASHIVAVEESYGIALCDPFAAKRLVELTLRIEDPRFISQGRGRRFARDLLHGHVPDQVASGRIDWQQGTDWRGSALKSRDAMLADLDEGTRDPDLGAIFDVPAMKQDLEGWSTGRDSIGAMSRAGAVMRAVAAIRFARIARSVS